MDPNQTRRLILNIVSTSGRALFVLVCGLLAGRWSLLALGEVDYGLFSLIGSLVIFISLLNSILSVSVGRFYAVAVGAARTSKETGLEECRRWFTVATCIHTIVPIVLIIIGYPVGAYLIEHYLVIPSERLHACIWVFRFACVSCFIAMVSVPFNAMYIAKQYVAELTIYTFVTTAANVGALYYMVTHEGDWLIQMSIWTCLLTVAPQVIIAMRSIILFPECRFKYTYIFDIKRFRQLFAFAGWQFWGSLGNIFKNQGVGILVNKTFGPQANTSFGIGLTVAGRVQALGNECSYLAFTPAIANALGEGNRPLLLSLIYKCCKFSTLLILIFALPLTLELPEVMTLWLKELPRYATGICYFVLWMCVLEKLGSGHEAVLSANGKIALVQMFYGGALILNLPCVWLGFKMGLNLYAIGISFFLTTFIYTISRIILAKYLIAIPIRYWLVHVVIPIITVMGLVLIIGYLPHFFMAPTFLRIVLTSVVCQMAFLPLTWFLILNKEERLFVGRKCGDLYHKVVRR